MKRTDRQTHRHINTDRQTDTHTQTDATKHIITLHLWVVMKI